MAACKLCGGSKPICKSHIIPKAVFRDAGPASDGLNLVTTDRVEKNKFGGEYEELLCRDCEERLGRYDDYGIRFLRGAVGAVIPDIAGQRIPSGVFELRSGLDLTSLRLFVIAVLWRASISSRLFYKHVQLGPYEGQAEDILRAGRAPPDAAFPFVIEQYTETDRARQIIIEPNRMRMDGRNAYNLNMRGYNFKVKVDRRPLPDSLRETLSALNGLGLVLVAKKSLLQSDEYGEIRRLVLSSSAKG